MMKTAKYLSSREVAKVVHEPGIYDLEINTSILNPDESVAKIQNMLSRQTFGVAKQEIINGGSKLGQY